ncbi:MAG: phosphoribosylformylglycinamidine synthase subunit PurL [Proteobacteria bacterium]|nr:phosphoribosylformylglycinamidine synthase subunit PurL [Pseudomonadota bacterium]
MSYRVEIRYKEEVKNPLAKGLRRKITDFLHLTPVDIQISDVFTIDAPLSKNEIENIAKIILCDPIIQDYFINPNLPPGYNIYLEVGFLPGVTDNVGKTAKSAIETFLGKKLKEQDKVYTSKLYSFKGSITEKELKTIALELLCNPLIEYYRIYKKGQKVQIYIPKVTLKNDILVEKIDLNSMNDEELLSLSKNRLLALNIDEMKAIKNFLNNKKIIQLRKKQGLDHRITDVELESIAQTWSEHCKHKIFNATIDYYDENGRKETIKSLFKTYIKASTEKIGKKRKDNFLVSVFVDNAGVISFDEKYNLVFKVETHNSPSALDPYGGALTGIVGVNRDVLGTGLGARLIFNTDIFCFADPFYKEKLPPRILHPRRIYDGVVTGVEHGGNKSGIPTINGSIVFDNRFLGKPLVYCGTGGIMPKEINGNPSHIKKINNGDLIVMCGGRIGKDGIHGATFSSEELHEGSPATAVQIGDPITQKKMADFLYIARDMGLYNAITDNGAGGLSSSVGEMSQMSGGCEIELDKAPLKYEGLNPWEILVSESQERMTISVPPDNIEKLLSLARKYDVEATVIGRFTNSGYFHCLYNGKTVAFLPLDFLHNGLPEMKLTARYNNPYKPIPILLKTKHNTGLILKKLLSSLNICSKESVVRKYDHEVQGMSVIKPLTGLFNDGPSDSAVIKPLPDSYKGIVVSHGICPKFSDYDTYNMSALALDEAVRNAVAVGGNINNMACLDNFCWCDPIKSEKNPDGEFKLAQLVRANKALYDYTLDYGIPCISGKDSMKNDYIMGDIKISIPPTLLFSLIGIIDDVRKTQTLDFKNPGENIYIAGLTKDELAGSEFLNLLKIRGGKIPTVNSTVNVELYKKIYKLISDGIISACHDISDGGFGVAIAEMAFSGGLGAKIDLENIPYEGEENYLYRLFSESAGRFIFTAKRESHKFITNFLKGLPFSPVGATTDNDFLEIRYKNKVIIKENIYILKEFWQKTLREL